MWTLSPKVGKVDTDVLRSRTVPSVDAGLSPKRREQKLGCWALKGLCVRRYTCWLGFVNLLVGVWMKNTWNSL